MKPLFQINKQSSGRNSSGKITVRGRGGRQKRYLRLIDWKRIDYDIPARVESIEYDPNRSTQIALLVYANGKKNYILVPNDLKAGDKVVTSIKGPVDIKAGNATLLKYLPLGTPVHNLEIRPGKGAQMVRSAGQQALIQSKDENQVLVKLPSGQVRIFSGDCKATIGALGNAHHKEEILGKAGRSRLLGWRPQVRGVAQDPRSHPHGGGEGRSGIGMSSPKSPWGKKTLGVKTRKKTKYSNKYIVKGNKTN